jgi:hypothetical protein
MPGSGFQKPIFRTSCLREKRFDILGIQS